MKKLAAYLILFLTIPSLTFGQVPTIQNLSTKPEVETVQETPTLPELTASDAEAFLDGIVPLQLERENIAGATVSIVKDGKVLLEKGYGLSDVENKTPVIANETMFRPGSISKLFAWTAVMQLFEQGKLDLDRDVNEYIDYKIPDEFGKPITIENLLTHTPGFEESVKDLITFKQESPDLGQYLKTHIPARIFPPGTVPAYSNYGAALAGYIVERVSGQPFSQYVEANIFKPLGMNHSSFTQPLPAEMSQSMSKGYQLATGKPLQFEVVSPFPAGSLSSTADDMSRFMLAHLQNGRFGDVSILKPETAELMHSRLFGLDPASNAMAYGFYEESRNGHRIIGHAGDTTAFHSDLHLILDSGIGFFVSYNSAGRGQVSPRTILWEAFLDRYFPFTPPLVPLPATADQDAAAVSGTYESSRRGEGSFFRAFSILGESKVSSIGQGTIQVSSLLSPNGIPKHWQAIAPMTFREIGGQDVLVFKPDENGRMQMIVPFPFMIDQRVGAWSNSGVLLPVLVVSLVIMLITLILWFVGWFIRRHYGGSIDLTRAEWWLRILVRFAFLFALIFLSAMIGLLIYAISNLDFLNESGNTWFQLVQVIGVVASVGTIIVFFNAVHAWLSKRATASGENFRRQFLLWRASVSSGLFLQDIYYISVQFFKMSNLNLQKIELREICLPLKAPFETSFGTTFERRVFIVRVFDANGATGYGECTAPENPFFNHETIETAWTIISRYISPILARVQITSAAQVSDALAHIRGNRMAIGAIESAIWDLEAKIENKPLWQHLGGTREEINCGVSVGLQKSTDILLEKVACEVESGYQRIKLKIKPGQDIELVRVIRGAFPDILLSVDANSAYRLEADIELFKRLDDFHLLMIEQPLSAGDLLDHSKLQHQIKTPICLDESITCLADVRHAIELDAARIINIKLGRVGGHSEAKKIQEFAASKKIPVWCGGMLESGIGRAHNIAMSTLPGFVLPGDVSASARYWNEDIIEPPVTVTNNGTIRSPSGPGIGYEVKESLVEKLTSRKETIELKPEAVITL